METKRLDINNNDFIIVVNSVDIDKLTYVFVPYAIEGNGGGYPVLNTTDVNSLLRAISPTEELNGRIPLDIVSAISADGSVLWNTPGLEGDINESLIVD